MRIAYIIGAVVGAVLVASCGTPESNARGITAAEATAIGRLVHDQTSSRIVSYTMERDGMVHVWTSDGKLYTARKIRGRWDVGETVYID